MTATQLCTEATKAPVLSHSPANEHDAGVLADLRGASRLAITAVAGITDLVEDMHRTIAGLAPVVGSFPAGRAGGLTGFVYGAVRSITRGVGSGIDLTLAGAMSLQRKPQAPSASREALRAVLNGVLGDHLADTGNPLATAMQLRHQGRRLDLGAPELAVPGERVLVLLHGLCMNDQQWLRNGHEHGDALARALGYTPLHLRYNSGRRIEDNGRDFAALMQSLADNWPRPLSELVLLGHSMGGLVARSACRHGAIAQMSWLNSLESLICLGSPHHGAALERAGHQFERMLAASPYTSPFTRVGGLRSAGIIDLRHGIAGAGDDLAERLHMPAHVRCFTVAASRDDTPQVPGGRLRGDGLVSVRSALGEHRDEALWVPIPDAHKHIVHCCNHFDLLGRSDVSARLESWLRQA